MDWPPLWGQPILPCIMAHQCHLERTTNPMSFYKKTPPTTNKATEPSAPASEPGTSLSDIQEYQLRWLWEQRVLRGKNTLIAVLDRKFSASRDQDMRHVLSGLAFLAQYTDCAILLVRHLNKGSLHNPLYRGSGSIGIIASARSGLLVVRDPSDENKRILTTTKNNLSIKAPNLTYNITANSDGIPTINWLGTSHTPLTHLLKSTSSLSSGRQVIVSLLHESDTPLGPKEIAEQTGQVGSQVRLVLRRMLNAQEIISPAYGLYTVHGHRSLKTPSLYQKTTPETLETLEAVSDLDSYLSDTCETPETLETVSDLDSYLPDTGETPETPETLDTLEAVNDLGSNSAPLPTAPALAEELPIT